MNKMNNKKNPISLICPYCDKEISSLSLAQAEYNYNLHKEACKKRLDNKKKKEVK